MGRARNSHCFPVLQPAVLPCDPAELGIRAEGERRNSPMTKGSAETLQLTPYITLITAPAWTPVDTVLVPPRDGAGTVGSLAVLWSRARETEPQEDEAGMGEECYRWGKEYSRSTSGLSKYRRSGCYR